MCKKGGARKAKWAQIPWWGFQSDSSALASLWVALLAQDHPVGIQGGKWSEADILQLDSGQPLFCFCWNSSKTFFKQTQFISCKHYFEVLSGVLHLALSFSRCVRPCLCRWQAVLLAFFLPPTLLAFLFLKYWFDGTRLRKGNVQNSEELFYFSTLLLGRFWYSSPVSFFFKIDLCLFYV